MEEVQGEGSGGCAGGWDGRDYSEGQVLEEKGAGPNSLMSAAFQKF